MGVTYSIIHDTRRAKKDGTFPVKLRIISDRKAKQYLTVLSFTREDYKKMSAPRLGEDLLKKKEILKIIMDGAKATIKELPTFSFAHFERDFLVNNPHFILRKHPQESITTDPGDVDLAPYVSRFKITRETHPGKDYISYTFASYVVRLLGEGRIGSALNYQDAYNSLKRFNGNVRFQDITVAYLHQYEQWMLNQGRSITTVGIKLRSLRAIFNEAIEKEIISRKLYPFGRRRYQLPGRRRRKKALTIDEVKKIYEYVPKDPSVARARDFWLFCYFGNGMNPKDMAHLRYSDIDGEYLTFVRAKTERSTRTDPHYVTVYVNDDMRRIIQQWGTDYGNPSDYIFPILPKEGSLLDKFNAVKYLIRCINENMALVANELQLSKKVTNMINRHTFSNVLRQSGVTTEFIQEALGHTDIRTTENYLESFGNEVHKQHAQRLKQW